ncbi:M1 family metallopeptidase [Paraglaciecola polaris]|uniref:Aminopeptidase n=3 Tax=Paraglaciecola polaris TaxID=222814 RepID=K6ZFE6_9ALTE|nr:M1 family metallopeptidase [Paraglaciecola polaris]GAC34761.1 cytosol alanyl aminopeptidase [Paraglaciecola polaris LMG 21857]
MTLIQRCLSTALGLLMITQAHASDIAYRLDENVIPTFQQIKLKIDPNQATFSGETTITVNIKHATDIVRFYQRDLDVYLAELIDGQRHIPLTVQSKEYDIQQGKASEMLPAKTYQLHMQFNGKVNTTSDGMYLSTFEGRNYIFTQFEDMHARRAFPGFDEPNFKIPYQLTITAPSINTVISNTPVASRTSADGWQTVTFKKTKPMPSYLVAFAVGELDSADITGLSVPGKIYTPKGQAHRTKFAVAQTPKILAALEDYFGTPYPYEKLDFIAVPNFTHGAMENAGLVTYRSSLLLLDDEPRLTEQSGPTKTIAHELAHMWYGNLVTMAWWDDLWLNEAFASWMESKITMALYPEQNTQAQLVQEGAFGADASPTTKAVKKEVRSQTDVMDGLGLNYSKGESVLQMIESLVGEDAFQKGVQSYMHKHAWGNAQADDLWEVLATVADFDVPAMMKTYLDQPGYPLINIAINGDVTQSRYHLAGANVKAQTWVVPLAIIYKKDGEIQRTSLFLDKAQVNMSELAQAQWAYPNDNAMGYMRWQIPAVQMQALLNDISDLNAREKKSLLYNSDALFNADKIPLDQHMAVLDALAQDSDPVVARSVVAALNDLTYLVDESNKALFAGFISAKLSPWFERLGVTEQTSDSNDVSRLRNAVFGMLGRYTQDAEVMKESKRISEKFLKDDTSTGRAIASSAMRSLAVNGDKEWFERFQSAYFATTDANTQSAIGYGMLFSEPDTIRKVLDMSLNNDVSPANVLRFISIASEAREDKDVLYQWLDKNMEKVTAKMPAYHIARMPEYVSASCSQHNIALAQNFYQQHMDKYDGMSRSFDVAQDESKQCVQLKDANQGTFNQYLQGTSAHF